MRTTTNKSRSLSLRILPVTAWTAPPVGLTAAIGLVALGEAVWGLLVLGAFLVLTGAASIAWRQSVVAASRQAVLDTYADREIARSTLTPGAPSSPSHLGWSGHPGRPRSATGQQPRSW